MGDLELLATAGVGSLCRRMDGATEGAGRDVADGVLAGIGAPSDSA